MGANGLKCAVIGTGAAALGVLSALKKSQQAHEISVFDIGKTVAHPALPPPQDQPKQIRAFYDQVYSETYKKNRRKFPPPKTHFAEQISRYPVDRGVSIFKSETFGGLTNYWGGTMLPFTEREMSRWPFGPAELAPYYREMAEIVGISGALPFSNEGIQADRLSEYFGEDFANRPALRPIPVLQRLAENLNRNADSKGPYKILAGANRCALETRLDQSNHCVRCGECMVGCFRDSIYSPRMWIENNVPTEKRIQGKVLQLDEEQGSLVVQTDSGIHTETGFDRIFLCAGCPATTEILMRTRQVKQGPVIRDNAVYVFPILYYGWGKGLSHKSSDYISLCNMIIGCIPETSDDHFAQVQVYPNFDYLWRYNIPPWLWPLLRFLVQSMRMRLAWGRLYVHSDLSQSFTMELNGDGLEFGYSDNSTNSKKIGALMKSIRTAIGGRGFWVPPIPPVRQKANSHYVGTLPFGNSIFPIDAHGQTSKRVYVCDSSQFPDSPAVNLTFTIMANALRIAERALSN